MMRSIILLMTILLFSQATFASHPEGIKDLINNYRYAVEVEWDQKDPQFLEHQNELLNTGIQSLIEQGANPRTLLDEVLADIPNEKFKKDVHEALTVAASPEQLNDMILKASAHSSAQGASWSVVAKIGIGVVGTLVVARLALEIYFYYWAKRF